MRRSLLVPRNHAGTRMSRAVEAPLGREIPRSPESLRERGIPHVLEIPHRREIRRGCEIRRALLTLREARARGLRVVLSARTNRDPRSMTAIRESPGAHEGARRRCRWTRESAWLSRWARESAHGRHRQARADQHIHSRRGHRVLEFPRPAARSARGCRLRDFRLRRLRSLGSRRHHLAGHDAGRVGPGEIHRYHDLRARRVRRFLGARQHALVPRRETHRLLRRTYQRPGLRPRQMGG